ncbi:MULTISPECIES: ABC transporter substrate-binding protein [unclassified Paenibacillus]|uniref:ABC transporter substrate-binding protein n=1 Tax=unclassified Paenibacillus TaxID=185978 RepID=UPI00104B57BD|nr:MULTISPECIES: ABC transporter substrate-binding protein [unclassified Paenibacillus]NIK72271.1 putative ABC transport system substrate-binding protein [Paenibacillus sp. BK720]TCM87407.1 putative ABC transport system substrate-binding protein [Paenibacillus sp. BK033]
MKKKWLVPLALVLLLVTAACGNSGKSNNENSSSGNAANAANSDAKKSYKISISQIVEHPSLDATKEGFLAALKDAGFVEGDNLTVDFNTAQGDQTNNLSIAQKIAGAKADLALGIATPSAQALVQAYTNAGNKGPVLFAAVTDPLSADLVSDLDAPGGNVTGASDTNPDAAVQLMDFIAANFPNVKKVGLVINKGESNAVVMAATAKEALAKHNIELIEAPVTNTSEVKQAGESLIGKVDAMYITLDNVVVSGVDALLQLAKQNHIPFFSSDRDTVEKGAFATVGFKYYDHGYQVGQMAAEILKGKNPGEMKVTKPDKLDLILNLKAAADEGITVTDAMKAGVKDPDNNIIQ